MHSTLLQGEYLVSILHNSKQNVTVIRYPFKNMCAHWFRKDSDVILLYVILVRRTPVALAKLLNLKSQKLPLELNIFL